MQKLKLVILRKIESKFKDSKYVADIVKINDSMIRQVVAVFMAILTSTTPPLMNIVIGSIFIFG